MSEYKITKISEVEQSHLSDFYKKNYFDRHKSLINNWKWWYRIGYSKFEPLIISSGEKVSKEFFIKSLWWLILKILFFLFTSIL